MPDLFTLAQAATALGVSPTTLRHQVAAGRLRATLYGRTYLIDRAELERYRRDSVGRPGRKATQQPPSPRP